MKDNKYCSECQGNGCPRCNNTGEIEVEICSECLCEYSATQFKSKNFEENDICIECVEELYKDNEK